MTTTTTTTSRTYQVTGMTCDHCASAVCNEVCAIDGVTDVQVEVATGAVTVTSTRPVPDGELAAAIDEAGYRLES